MIGTLLVSVAALLIAILGRALIGTTNDRISALRRTTDPLFRQAGIRLGHE